MFPEIPESLNALSVPELRALARDLRLAIQAAVADLGGSAEAGGITEAEMLSLCEAAKAGHEGVLFEIRRRELSDSTSDDSEDEVPPVVDDDDDGDDDENADENADPPVHVDGGGDDEDEVPVQASTTGNRAVRTSTGTNARPSRSPDRVAASQLNRVGGSEGETPFGSWRDFSNALIARASNIDSSSREKYTVGRARGTFDENHRLTEDIFYNLQLFERQADEELTAAMCAPAVPVYDLACANVTRRPVFNSLAAFQPAARGAVTIYPSPTLEDITTGFGQWTNTEDSDPEAVKEPCQTIECATPVEYRLYAIYRCLTVKNLLQLTFPELVEAYLNRLAARWARMGEGILLDAMGGEADEVEATHVGWNGTTSIVYAILQYLAAYQELQRWDSPEMDVWAHRGILLAIKADLMARRRTDGGRNTVPSDAEVNRIFNDAGVSVTWTLDTGNWQTAVPPFSVAGVLAPFTRNVELLIAPRGKFAVMDRGELNVGVTGNNIYRDNTSNSRNEFTFFLESFEGLVNTDSCPAHIVTLNDVCWNGQQIADVFIDCEGDQAGTPASGE